ARLGPTPFTDRAASAGVAPLSNMAKMTDASIAPDNCTSPMRSAHASWNAAYPNGSHALYSMICFKVSSVARRFSRSESHSLNAVLLSIDIDIPSCLAPHLLVQVRAFLLRVIRAGTPCWNRTSNLHIRNVSLYPLS